MRALAILLGILIFASRFAWWLVKLAVPHFVTKDCACEVDARGKFFPVCEMDFVLPGDTYAGIATYRYISWLGFGLVAFAATPLRPWMNPHDQDR